MPFIWLQFLSFFALLFTRPHGFSLRLTQILLYKMLQKGAWSSPGWCLPSTPHALTSISLAPVTSVSSICLAVFSFKKFKVIVPISPSSHLPIPKPLVLQGSFSKFTVTTGLVPSQRQLRALYRSPCFDLSHQIDH